MLIAGLLCPGVAEAKPISENDSVEDTLAAMPYHLSRGAYNALDHYYLYLMEKLTPMQVLDHLLQVAVPKNQADDHYFLFPVFAWRALEYFGWDYAKYIGRSAVRYVTRPPAARVTLEIDELIEEHGLLKRVPRFKTGPDETPAVVALRDKIATLDEFEGIPAILAKALGDGLSLEGTIEGLSLGGSHLFLRSQTGNPMDVHIHTGANTRRYLLGQSELAMATRLRALLSWHTGPEIRSAQYKLAPQQQPEEDRVAALPPRDQDDLLADIEDLIASLPVGERLPSLGLAQWRCTDEVKQAAAMAQPSILITTPARCSTGWPRSPAATILPRCTPSSITRRPMRNTTRPAPNCAAPTLSPPSRPPRSATAASRMSMRTRQGLRIFRRREHDR